MPLGGAKKSRSLYLRIGPMELYEIWWQLSQPTSYSISEVWHFSIKVGGAYDKKTKFAYTSPSNFQIFIKNHPYVSDTWNFSSTSRGWCRNFHTLQPMVNSEVRHSTFFKVRKVTKSWYLRIATLEWHQTWHRCAATSPYQVYQVLKHWLEPSIFRDFKYLGGIYIRDSRFFIDLNFLTTLTKSSDYEAVVIGVLCEYFQIFLTNPRFIVNFC